MFAHHIIVSFIEEGQRLNNLFDCYFDQINNGLLAVVVNLTFLLGDDVFQLY